MRPHILEQYSQPEHDMSFMESLALTEEQRKQFSEAGSHDAREKLRTKFLQPQNKQASVSTNADAKKPIPEPEGPQEEPADHRTAPKPTTPHGTQEADSKRENLVFCCPLLVCHEGSLA